MGWCNWDVQGRADGKDLPKMVIYAELAHDAQREYAERAGIPEDEIEWLQHEPAIDQWQ